MLDQGNEAHRYREEHCDAHEIAIPGGRIDCAMATGETCLVIELKPDNPRAIRTGISRLGDYVKTLDKEAQNPDSDTMQRLRDANSNFAKCKRFEPRLDCYKLCPDIDEDDNFRETRVDWRTNCE